MPKSIEALEAELEAANENVRRMLLHVETLETRNKEIHQRCLRLAEILEELQCGKP